MNDIAQRLRNFVIWNSRHSHYDPVPLCQEAALCVTELADAAESVLLTTPAERQDPRVWFGRVDALKLAIKVARGEIPHGASVSRS